MRADKHCGEASLNVVVRLEVIVEDRIGLRLIIVIEVPLHVVAFVLRRLADPLVVVERLLVDLIRLVLVVVAGRRLAGELLRVERA